MILDEKKKKALLRSADAALRLKGLEAFDDAAEILNIVRFGEAGGGKDNTPENAGKDNIPENVGKDDTPRPSGTPLDRGDKEKRKMRNTKKKRR